MWKINSIVSKGNYLYAVVPNHPHRTKNNYVLLHRVIMENYLGRLLKRNEVVHHIDENGKNNKLSNLKLMSIEDHNRLHSSTGRKTLYLRCPWCGKHFVRPANKTFLNKPNVLGCTCCSAQCRGKLSRCIQLNGRTRKIAKAIKDNIRYLTFS
jgi:hypothetical protein